MLQWVMLFFYLFTFFIQARLPVSGTIVIFGDGSTNTPLYRLVYHYHEQLELV
jgi:hypothetical protein